MKNEKEKVPEFDDIIFENRNRTYGAYNLRKQYKSTTSLSVIGGAALCTMLVIGLSLSTEPGTATAAPDGIVIITIDPLRPEAVKPPDTKPPEKFINNIKNLKPVVTEDTSEITDILPTTDDIIRTVENGNPVDSMPAADNTEPVIPPEKEPYISVEEMPSFPGGEPALFKFIGENLKYPLDAQANNIQGKVILKFVVTPDGSADRIEILRSVDPSLDNEAMRVIKILPRFKPGKQGGVAVPVWYMIPVSFRIEEN
jgi:periplasmic protein TonB